MTWYIYILGRYYWLLYFQRGDYQVKNSSFPVTFFRHNDRTLLIAGKDWNYLEVYDPETGEELRKRESKLLIDHIRKVAPNLPPRSWWKPFGIFLVQPRSVARSKNGRFVRLGVAPCRNDCQLFARRLDDYWYFCQRGTVLLWHVSILSQN